MEHIKRSMLNIYLKTAVLPLIEASHGILKIEKFAIFEWLKI